MNTEHVDNVRERLTIAWYPEFTPEVGKEMAWSIFHPVLGEVTVTAVVERDFQNDFHHKDRESVQLRMFVTGVHEEPNRRQAWQIDFSVENGNLPEFASISSSNYGSDSSEKRGKWWVGIKTKDAGNPDRLFDSIPEPSHTSKGRLGDVRHRTGRLVSKHWPDVKREIEDTPLMTIIRAWAVRYHADRVVNANRVAEAHEAKITQLERLILVGPWAVTI